MRTYSFFVHTVSSTVPTLLIKAATDDMTARRLAKAALAESTERLMVEVREDDRLLFTLDRNGASWDHHESRPDD